MARRIRTNGARQTRVALLLCAVLTMGPAAAAPTLESVAVTPASGAISVGQTQLFKATGTFSDGSVHGLGPAIANIAPIGLFSAIASPVERPGAAIPEMVIAG